MYERLKDCFCIWLRMRVRFRRGVIRLLMGGILCLEGGREGSLGMDGWERGGREGKFGGFGRRIVGVRYLK